MTEPEPVAYVNLDEKRLEWAAPFNFKSSCFVLGKLPLYFHPPKSAEPEAEPVGWLASYPENPDLGNWFCHTNFADYEGVKCEPLYLHPPRPEPARKLIDDNLIMLLAREKGFDRFETWAFSEGIRYAEKYHGIGGCDE